MRTGTKEKFYIRWILAAICLLAFCIPFGSGCGRISSAIHPEEDAFQAAESEKAGDLDKAGDSDRTGDLDKAGDSDRTGDLDKTGDLDNAGDLDKAGDSDRTGDLDKTGDLEGFIYIHVCGEVKKPGLYRLAAGSRAGDALEIAGGFTRKADRVAVNLAAPLEDGQQIYVPDRSETEGNETSAGSGSSAGSKLSGGSGSSAESGLSGGSGSSAGSESSDGADTGSSGKVNINTAGMEELITLQGIGESRAAAILDYRRKNGSFSSISDIRNVSGIGEGIYSRIKDSITV